MINYWQMLIVIFCAINPLLAMVVFANLRQKLNLPEQILVAALSSLSVFCLLSISLMYGRLFLDFLGIEFYILEVGGGLLILAIGMFFILANEQLWEARFYLQKITNMFGMSSKIESYKLNANSVFETTVQSSGLPLGVSPLAIPIMVNPASLLITLYLNNQVNQNSRFAILLLMLVISLLIFLILVGSSYLLKHLTQVWLITLNRLTGLFLTVIALEMLIAGLRDLLGTLGGG